MAAPTLEHLSAFTKVGTDVADIVVALSTADVGETRVVRITSDESPTFTWPAGWNTTRVIVSGQLSVEVGWRTKESGDPDSITVTTSTGQQKIAISETIAGWDGSAPTVISNSNFDTSLDIGNLTGLVSGDYLFMGVGACDQHRFGWAYPTGYAGSDDRSATSGSTVSMARFNKSATGVTAEDIAAFSHSGIDDNIGILLAFKGGSPSSLSADATQTVDGAVLAVVATGMSGPLSTATVQAPGLAVIDIASRIQAGATATNASLAPILFADLAPGGLLNSLPPDTDVSLVMGDGTNTASTTFQIRKADAAQLGLANAGPHYPSTSIASGGLGLSSWDDLSVDDHTYAEVLSGAGFFVMSSVAPQPTELSMRARIMYYDKSAGQWKGGETFLVSAVEAVSLFEDQTQPESTTNKKISKPPVADTQVMASGISLKSIKGGSVVNLQLPVENISTLLLTRSQLVDLMAGSESVNALDPLPFGSQNVYVLVGVVPDGENEIHEMIGVV